MINKAVEIIIALFLAAILGGVALNAIATQGTASWSAQNVTIYGVLGTIGIVAVMVVLVRGALLKGKK